MKYTKLFSELRKTDADIAGGKGASLGEMLNAGIPVPDGYVVLSTTFDAFLKKSELIEDIDAILEQVNHKAVHSVDEASEKIQELIKHAEMPEEIAEEIRINFETLGSEFVAVRSSATAEDGADHAWAGQLDSYLNTTKKDLMEKVQHCWASLFTPRAIFYRFEKGLDSTKISVAVVVQKMVNSEKSGIAFSVHPVTEDRNQLIIEAGFGLGEAIVSGSVTPDSYVVEKVSRKIIDTYVSEQTRALYRKAGGGNEWIDLNSAKASSQVLNEEEIKEFSDIIIGIENHYGFPCDIEWAYEGGKFYITQSRPITTLSKQTENKKIKFEKIYTRDTTFIMQELWASACVVGVKEKFGIRNPHSPEIIHYMNEGSIEIWENREATQYLMDAVLDKNNNDPHILKQVIKEYETQSKELAVFWKESYLSDLKKFDGYIAKAAEAVVNFVFFYYSAVDERTPKELREIALALREKDLLFSTSDVFIRDTLVHHFPHIEGFETAIFRNEVYSIPEFSQLQFRRAHTVLIDGVEIYVESLDGLTKRFPDFEFVSEKAEHTGVEIKGQNGYKGKVRGSVRILRRRSQVKDVQEGEIIVSPMTTPDFMPAMEKALAFVTDEGGITCHAAIVARELGKPCVIGTKFATQILHDGDEIEVDANTGIVTILSQKHSDTQIADDLIPELKKVDWEIQRFNSYPFFISSVATLSGFKLPWNLTYKHFLCFAHNKNTQWHYDKADYTRIGEVFWNKVKTLEDLEVLISKYRTEYNTAVKNSAYEQHNLENLSISELKNLLQKQIDRLCESAGIAHLIEAASFVAEKKLVDEYKIDTQNIKASDLSFIKKAAIFAHALVESEKNDETILDEFKKKYAWIQSSYLGRNEITISEIRKLAERHDETQVSSPSNNFVGIISRMFSWQDERKGNILESIYCSEPVLFALADALGISRDAIVFLLPEEISKIENKEFQKELVDRTNVFVDYATHDSSRATFVGSEAQKFIDDFSLAIEHKDEIKGAIAYPGNVTGVVRVCLSMQSIESFKEGEILVASMTRPEYVPAMKKAIAFITDEGGITCHAAIIAREMKKPCVIGTKNATKVLKDGDTVELDSTNGIVRIVSRVTDCIEEQYFKDTTLLVSRPQTVQRDELCYALIQNYKDLSPKIITIPLEDKNRSLYLGREFTEKMYKKYFSDLNSEKGFSEYVSRYKKLQKELSKIASKNEKTRKKKEEIVKTIERFIEGVAKLADYIWSPFLVETVFDKKLHEMLQNVYPEKAEYYYGIFTSPTELHEYQKIRMAICEAVIKNKNTAKIAQKLADEYSWHGEYSYIEDLLDKEHFIHEINTLTILAAKNEYERIVDGINHNKKEFTKALKEIKDPTILLYGKIVNKYVFLRTDRVDELKKMQKSMRVCFDYIAEFLTHDSGVLWTRKNVANLLNEEIIGYLKQGVLPDFDFVNARAENYIYARDMKKTQMITNPDQIAKIVSLVVESKDSNTMSGKIAFKGIATGPVVMVFGKNDLHKVTHDSILVARTTMVDYTPAMERAMAFVTEEGGVTSHAAIVARELKKPCIVGVKNVTKLLKDGDMVEVDANTGVVKILNSNENILSKKNIDGNFLTQNDIKPPFIYKGFHALFYPIDFVQLCWNKWGDYSGYYYKAHITAFHDSYWDLYYLPQEFTKLRNHYFDKLKEDKNFLQKHVADWSDACHKLEIIIKSFEQNFNSDFEAFKQIYTEAIDMYVYEYGLSAPAQEACGFQPEQWITPKIEAYAKKYGLDFQDTFSLLTAPTVNSFITEEEIGLYDIILHSAEVDTYAFDELVSIHAHNYFWIKNNYAETNVLDKDYFLERIEELKKEDMKHLKDRYEEMISYPHIKNEEKKEIFKQYPPDEELALYTKVNETFAYMQDVRKSFVLKMNYYHRVFLERVASEYERNMQDLYLYGYNELIQAIDGGIWIDANEISNRKKMIVAIETKTEKNIFSGAMAIELYKQLQSTEAVSNTIKGIVAQKGIARGPAKIVLKTHHILKVQKGDIMVSSMTRPEMTSAMQKAVAFVTDEGGITCHAAIIAREMKKPCVIGTKNATKVIHDGDIIEVDANTGIITIIG